MVASQRSVRVRWVSLGGVGIGLAAFVVFLVIQLSHGDLDRGDKLASIVSMSVAVAMLPLGVVAVVASLRPGGQKPPVDGSLVDRLDAVSEVLAVAMQIQWETEEQVRRVHDPFPLPVRWVAAAEQVMDHWPNINGGPGRDDPVALAGEGNQIVETFERVPSGRLVVLGRAGAGKTVLASRFALALLARQSGPVPVIFSLGSWDPAVRPLRLWLAAELIAVYPRLAERDATGATLAELMLVTGRVMPVLDGFDEISESRRIEAITAINAGLRHGDQLVLTSRPEEYAAAVWAGDVLSAAAVVHLEPLTISDLTTYLPLTTRKFVGGLAMWQLVLDYLRDHPHTQLNGVLATPLMVALARAIYSDTGADPTELLGINSVSAIEDRLLAGFVPAVYSGESHRSISSENARRWLGFLADHLDRQSTYDLAWWRLFSAVPRTVLGLVSGLVIALMPWLFAVLLSLVGEWTNSARLAWLVGTSIGAISFGMAGGIVVAGGRGLRPSPSRLRLRPQVRIEDILAVLPLLQRLKCQGLVGEFDHVRRVEVILAAGGSRPRS